ncbi:Ribosomal silencing factor RsfS [Neomoorella glycerini]|uniref:Ribosomal silencing factor RsfS n=1 Tax=Neomoorella glycerini TaxID=55779 RepID=A0A6I5ZRJ4_9FIRM|nr:ribosome silencing factor [Moorella glycerini]QGP92460.1 Ribosomal silencing factor RsfS [Moorella glycerini]
MDAARVAELAARAVGEKKGLDPVILDLRGITLIADYFVIASGTSATQVQAIAGRVEELLEAAGVKLLHREGWDAARWILLDYGAVVVHIFQEEERRFYDLERLWRDARVIKIDAV